MQERQTSSWHYPHAWLGKASFYVASFSKLLLHSNSKRTASHACEHVIAVIVYVVMVLVPTVLSTKPFVDSVSSQI